MECGVLPAGQAAAGKLLSGSPRMPSLCMWSLGQPASCGPDSAQRGRHTRPVALPLGHTAAWRSA